MPFEINKPVYGAGLQQFKSGFKKPSPTKSIGFLRLLGQGALKIAKMPKKLHRKYKDYRATKAQEYYDMKGAEYR